MSNDKVQSIMALVDALAQKRAERTTYKSDRGVMSQRIGKQIDELRVAIESAIREAIAAPGVATDEKTIALAMLAVDDPLQWGRLGPDSKKMIVQFVRALAAPSPTAEQHDHFDEVVKMVPPASSPVDAARSVAKWLNERPNRPINLEDVAMLVHHVQSQPVTIKGGPAE